LPTVARRRRGNVDARVPISVERIVSAAVALWLLAATTPAHAEDRAIVPDQELGEPWQYLLTSDSHIELQEDRLSETRGGVTSSSKVFSMLVRVAADRVMRHHLTLGAHVSLEADEHGTVDVIGFLGGIRAGWLQRLGASDRVFVWARAGLSYGSFTYSFEGEGSATVAVLRADLSCPVLFAIAHRVVIGVGPFLEHDLSKGVGPDDPIPKITTIGVQGLIGGWFHGF
jgi:hypothetical protein